MLCATGGRPVELGPGLARAGFDDHARFAEDLVNSGFIVPGGPLQGEREVLIIVSAPDEDTVRQRFTDDPWIRNGMHPHPRTAVDHLARRLPGHLPNPTDDLPAT
jgi:hypothetical protein